MRYDRAFAAFLAIASGLTAVNPHAVAIDLTGSIFLIFLAAFSGAIALALD